MASCASSSSAFTQALYEVAPRLSRRWFLGSESCTVPRTGCLLQRQQLRKYSATASPKLISTRRSIQNSSQTAFKRCPQARAQVAGYHCARPFSTNDEHHKSNLYTQFDLPSFSKTRLGNDACQVRRISGSSQKLLSYNTNARWLRKEVMAHTRRKNGTGALRAFTTDSKKAEEDRFSSPGEEHAGSQQEREKKGFFPETSSNTVAYWLLASAASVFGIVVFGGLTRLTESGLSITEWRPVTGSLPPLSDADWESEFAKYRSSPEFRVLNSRMNLEEFKSIYWMEWIHRVWGRAVGLTFILPAAYFIARRRVSKGMMYRLAGIGGLIGFQGFIGWWMVKSGLKDDFLSPDRKPGRDVPRVSQYRLAAHLGTAFVCYLAMLWNGLTILRTNKLVHKLSTDAASSQLFALRNPALRPFKISVALLAGLVFTTAMSGALVAGLDAGLIYNEFPYMGLGLSPPRSELFDSFYSHKADHSDLYWRNFLENPSLVQLDHRILATSTFTAVMALWAYTRFSHNMKSFLPKAAARGVHGVVGFAWLQVILGISTLIYMVPIPLASAHQAGALALLTWTTVLGSRIWFPTYVARLVQKRIAAGSAGEVAKKSAAYDFPAIPKVKPQLGQGGEAAADNMLRASLGWPAFGRMSKTDVGLAASSVLIALAVLNNREASKKEGKDTKHSV